MYRVSNDIELVDNILKYLSSSCTYITISFGALIYAHDNRNINIIYSILLIIIACIGIFSSLLVNILLSLFLQKYKNNDKFHNIYNWMILNISLYIIHIILIGVSGYILYKSIKKV